MHEVVAIMEHPIDTQLSVDLVVDANEGPDWYTAK